MSFIENQIQTCVAIQSPAELEHWYSILGLHLSKHGEEKRIRTHLNDLLGTPEGLMELDDEEPVKESILVGIPIALETKADLSSKSEIFPEMLILSSCLFVGSRKAQTVEIYPGPLEDSTPMAANLYRILPATEKLKRTTFNATKMKTHFFQHFYF